MERFRQKRLSSFRCRQFPKAGLSFLSSGLAITVRKGDKRRLGRRPIPRGLAASRVRGFVKAKYVDANFAEMKEYLHYAVALMRFLR